MPYPNIAYMQHYSNNCCGWQIFLVSATQQREVARMLRLTLSTEEYLMLGDDIKIVFLGGSNNHLRIMWMLQKRLTSFEAKCLKKHIRRSRKNIQNIMRSRICRNAIARKKARQSNRIIIGVCVPAGGPKAGTGTGYYK